jgi:hypothetical protein
LRAKRVPEQPAPQALEDHRAHVAAAVVAVVDDQAFLAI